MSDANQYEISKFLIGEEHVVAWVKARLDEIRKEESRARCIALTVYYNKKATVESYWELHDENATSVQESSSAMAFLSLQKQYLPAPLREAARKRKQAADLIREADELEKLGVTLESKV